jgi:serine/threonine protein kinase/Tfp pilus assembly protein PilF
MRARATLLGRFVLSRGTAHGDTGASMDPLAGEDLPSSAAPYGSGQLDNVASAVRELEHPTQVGPYLIQGVIGEGGMGTVYKAEQRTPIRRTVALKLVKLGMDTRQVIHRFESERQALALMNHPNVAKVLDAGATEAGRPYFVMEYVGGEPITRFADRYKLRVRQRLELIVQACAGVQHAHQKAIIHRDLKPSNILVSMVDDKPVAKVIDFGMAKALSQRLTERTLFTETGQLVGTPEYMAPEQAESAVEDVDTRTDVYSLGVVLYELLTGALPFDPKSLRGAGYSEIQRIIRETDPPRPSTRLSRLGDGAREVARLRQTPLDELCRQLRGELEWIPLKAMHKERARRYASATELADDVQNYLAERPLRAGPESAAYRMRKFLRRHRLVVMAVTGMLLLLVAGAATTTWQAVRATRAQRATRAALEELRLQKKEVDLANKSVSAVNEFLTQEILVSSTPDVTRGKPLTVLEALDNAARRIKGKFDESPAVEAAVRGTVSRAYHALGRAELALPQAREAVAICERALPPEHPITVAAMNQLAQVLEERGDYKAAESTYRDALARSRRASDPQLRDALSITGNLGRVVQRQGRLDEAEPLCREAAEGLSRLLGNDDSYTLDALNSLGIVLDKRGKSAEAEALLRQVLEARLRTEGSDHPHTLTAGSNLANVLVRRGKLDEAEPLLREVVALTRRVFGEDHHVTITTINSYASLKQELGGFDESEALFREALEKSRRALDANNPVTLTVTNNLATVLKRRGKVDEAIELYRDGLNRHQRLFGAEHPNTILSMNNLGQALFAKGSYDEAERLFAEVYRRVPQSQIDPRTSAIVMSRWGPCLVEMGRYAEAEAPLLEAHRRLTATGQAQAPATAGVLDALAKLCAHTNRPDEAAQWRARLAALKGPASQPAATTRAAA